VPGAFAICLRRLCHCGGVLLMRAQVSDESLL
jgi:hypothetical protein